MKNNSPANKKLDQGERKENPTNLIISGQSRIPWGIPVK